MYIISIWVFWFFITCQLLLARAEIDCGLINKKIYCYNGQYASLYSLDVVSDTPVSMLDRQWQLQNVSLNDKRVYSTFVTITSANSLFVYGGLGIDANKSLTNHAIVYEAEPNIWERISNYTNSKNNTSRQIFLAAAVYASRLGAVVFYGGHEMVSTNMSESSNASVTSAFGVSTRQGFEVATLYNLGTDTWSTFLNQANPMVGSYPILQTATFHPSTGKIFYLGGWYISATISPASFAYGMVFNTNNGMWSNISFGGKAPSPRDGHTATLLPSGNDILLYGGSLNSTVALSDFCYSLNLDNMYWTEHTELYDSKASGIRTRHSAVLIDQTLFILFGIDSNGNKLSNMLAVNVYDPNSLSFSSAFHTNRKNLSVGAIVGIVIGSVVGLAIVLILIIFYLRKKLARSKDESMLASAFQKEVVELENWEKSEISAEANQQQPVHVEQVEILAQDEDHTLAITANNSSISVQEKKTSE
ncbi:uncharacterized protein B0P05DRAFT_529509 [Gilbertella persicaria]|uniref:uncharacterized protein n=1 Tax=Gilbertella persicaria TaxID=101096 RepID=UPI00221EF538|nr:uncharacterized protein B0P05DRAFT_529509 [Gilbertella persicaria]KAI8090132.1 hypothetical protein B0P05DRAFT_529509 [Gilbertella persicaria]